MNRTESLTMCITLLIGSCISVIFLEGNVHSITAQLPSNTTHGFNPYEIRVQIPYWVKNNTGLWAKEKLADSQFILGVRYLAANDVMPVPPELLDNGSAKPVPSWVKAVASWWADGSISDYEFISDIQYLVIHDDMGLRLDTNKTNAQESSLLQNNFPKGVIRLDNVTLDVQVADTQERMTEGLQFQQPLSYHQGMIFIFPSPQVAGMWMKDMQFPLDMMWFDSNGNVIHIEKNLPPCNQSAPCQVYDGGSQDTKYVLEVTSGFVDKFNVTEKSKIVILAK